MSRIAVIDTETNYSDRVMSVGIVVADSKDYLPLDSRYYILTPECRRGGMFSHVLRLPETPKPIVASREDFIADLTAWLDGHGVESVYAYNARFDKTHLPELGNYRWYDIMRLAAYRQYNSKIPRDAECCATGRLKHHYGVQPMYRLLSGEACYCEKHNGWCDALDELRLMELLALPPEAYEVGRI